MNTTIVQIILLFVIIASISPLAIAGEVQKHIVPTLLKYQPVPAEPGNFVDVWLSISNQRESVHNLAITLQPEYPFRLSEDENPTRIIPVIPTTDDALLKYRVFIDLDARNQEYNMTWTYTYDGQGGIIRYEAPITVQATDASLTVDHYTITPTPVRPGANASLSLTLKNNGKITLKDVDVNLDLTSSSFSTFGTGTVQRLKLIGPGDLIEVTYQLISDPKSETKVHNLPIALTFRDERNNRYNTSSRLAAIVNTAPRLLTTVQESGLTGPNSTGDISFKVVNAGAVDLKFLTFALKQSPEYEILSPSNSAYLGNLDADDFETAEFKVRSINQNPKFLVELDYSDPYNTHFTQGFTVPLSIRDPATINGESSSSTGMIIGAILILLVALWFARKRLARMFA